MRLKVRRTSRITTTSDISPTSSSVTGRPGGSPWVWTTPITAPGTPTAYDRLSDSIELEEYNINRLTPMVFYDFENRFSAGLRFRRTDLWYKNENDNDSVEHRIIGNLLYNPTRTSTFDLDLQHWWMDYDNIENDYISDQIKFIYQKRYKYFAFDAGVGYHMRDYDNPDIEDGDTIAYKFSVLAQNPPPPEGRRHLGNQFVRSRTHGYLAFERNFNNYGADYIAHRLTADVGHVFVGKIQARIRGYYQMSAYETARGTHPRRQPGDPGRRHHLSGGQPGLPHLGAHGHHVHRRHQRPRLEHRGRKL